MGDQGRDGRTARRHHIGHTGILRRGVWCAIRRPPLGVCLFLSLFAVPRRFSLQPSCHLAVFPLSSFSLLSLLPLSLRSPLPRSATTPLPPACRSLALASRRNSALLAAYPGPSSLSSSPRARMTLLTPTAIICRPVISLLRSTLSSDTCTSTADAGAGVPLGCIVTADNGISTGSSSSESSSPSSFRSALRLVRSVWLTLHAVNRRFIHPIFFSRSSALALVLSLFRIHVSMAIEAAFPTTCSSLVTSPASSPLFLSGMGSVSAGSVHALTGAILSYSSSASAPNLDPFAFKEAALARLRNVAVSFESGASRSTLAVALAVCSSRFRIERRASSLFPAQLPLSMCANDACGSPRVGPRK